MALQFSEGVPVELWPLPEKRKQKSCAFDCLRFGGEAKRGHVIWPCGCYTADPPELTLVQFGFSPLVNTFYRHLSFICLYDNYKSALCSNCILLAKLNLKYSISDLSFLL